MTIFRDLFGRPAPDGAIKTLKVLDCSDIVELAGMYGEAGTCLTDAEYDAIDAAENSGDKVLAKSLMDKAVRRVLESYTRELDAEFEDRVKTMRYQSRYDRGQSLYEDRKTWA